MNTEPRTHDRSYVRRQMISASSYWTGLDFINTAERGKNRYRLLLSFIPAGKGAGHKRPVPAGITADSIRITQPDGFARTGLSVDSVAYVEGEPTHLVVDVSFAACDVSGPAAVAETLMLAIVGIPSLDEIYSAAELRLDRAADVPWVRGGGEPEDRRWPTDVDYLSKDYESFKLLMLKYLSEHYPAWKERSEADIGIMLIELLAYAGDYLSDYQDNVATEAYLGTSRLRTSVRRHGVLLDYPLSDGCNSRMWVHVDVSQRCTLPRSTLIQAGAQEVGQGDTQAALVLRKLITFFETMYEVDLDPALNAMDVYTWGSSEFALPKGATSAALQGRFPQLKKGDVLILEQQARAQAGVTQVHPVRLSATPILDADPLVTGPDGRPAEITLIEWFPDDRLPASFVVATRYGGAFLTGLTRVMGNNVLADHGRTLHPAEPLTLGAGERARLEIKVNDLTYAVPFSAAAAVGVPAALALDQDPGDARAAVTLQALGTRDLAARAPMCPPPSVGVGVLARRASWSAVRTLIDSNQYARHFVVEGDVPGKVVLRFGDDLYGSRPDPGTVFEASYRTGNGPEGNIGARTSLLLVSPVPGVQGLSNPLPARGGRAAERLETARLDAPSRMNEQARMVIEEDYVRAALELPGVIGANAALLFNGSWYTAELSIQRSSGEAMDEAFRERLAARLDPMRLMGVSLDLRDPTYVAVDIVMDVVPVRGVPWPDVLARLQRVFSAKAFADGLTGFFFPGDLHFGESLYASQILAAALNVYGVASASLSRLARVGEPPGETTAAGVVPVAANEIIQVLSDPEAPEKGSIVFRPEEAP